MTYVHIVFDTFNNSVVIVTTSLKVAQTVAATGSTLTIVQDQPVIDL